MDTVTPSSFRTAAREAASGAGRKRKNPGRTTNWRLIVTAPCPHAAWTVRTKLYLSGLDRAIIASCGTGTALVYAEDGKDPLYLGGTGVGGGTLVGLSKKMLGMDNVDHISDLAKGGSLDRVDLKIKDITKTDIVPGFSDIMTASNFGQVSDLATREDIACGETIGMISIFAARNYGIRDVVLTGNLSRVPQAESVFATLNRMFDMNFSIPENSAFGTVIGAALAGIGL